MARIYKSAAGQQAVETLYRTVLQRWPVAHQELSIPTCQGDTFVIASGDRHAPPLVLLHGSGTNSSVWMRDVAHWARGCRVYAIDVIGEPGFSAASRPALASGAYAAWLDHVWDRLGIASAAIVGVSHGGWLALDYAVRRSHRVAAISLLSPSGIGRQNRLVLLKAGLLMLCGTWGLRRSLRIVAGRTSLPREMSDFTIAIFRHFRPRMARLPLRADEELASLAMPVQAILGGRDVLLRSHETRARLERLVPRLHLTWLEDEGHILPTQAEAVLAFLASACPQAPVQEGH